MVYAERQDCYLVVLTLGCRKVVSEKIETILYCKIKGENFNLKL